MLMLLVLSKLAKQTALDRRKRKRGGRRDLVGEEGENESRAGGSIVDDDDLGRLAFCR